MYARKTAPADVNRSRRRHQLKKIRTCNNHPLILRELTTGHKYSRQ